VKNKTLFILTSEFPFGNSETFLENEIPFLIQTFEKVIFVPSKISGENRGEKYSIEILKIKDHFNNKNRLKALFSTILIKEVLGLIFKNKFSLYRFRTAWNYLTRAIFLKSKIVDFIEFNKIKKNECVFYSYWLDEKSLAISMMNNEFKPNFKISRAHGWDIYEERHHENYLPFRSQLINKLSLISTISKNGMNHIKSLSKVKNIDSKVKVNYLGTLPIKRNVNFSVNESSITLLSISSLISLKRVELIINALSFVSNKNIKWIHIGDGPLKEKLIEEAKIKLEKKVNITFEFKGHLTNTDVRNFLTNSSIDWFINVSETEGLPVTFMEVMSVGIPVIATNVGGVPEIVNSENGILIERNFKIEELSMIFENLDKNDFKGENALNTWEKKFDAAVNYKLFTKILEEGNKVNK
jgi:glycosyltransferase involved in cell wall biosynthesis